MRKIAKPKFTWLELYLLSAFLNAVLDIIKKKRLKKESYLKAITEDGWNKLEKLNNHIRIQIGAYYLNIIDENVKFKS